MENSCLTYSNVLGSAAAANVSRTQALLPMMLFPFSLVHMLPLHPFSYATGLNLNNSEHFLALLFTAALHAFKNPESCQTIGTR